MANIRDKKFVFVLCVLAILISAKDTQPYKSPCSECDKTDSNNPCAQRGEDTDGDASLSIAWLQELFPDWITPDSEVWDDIKSGLDSTASGFSDGLYSIKSGIFDGLSSFRNLLPRWTSYKEHSGETDDTVPYIIVKTDEDDTAIPQTGAKKSVDDEESLSKVTLMFVIIWLYAVRVALGCAVRYRHAMRARALSQDYDPQYPFGHFVSYVAGFDSGHLFSGNVEGLNIISDMDLRDEARDQVVDDTSEQQNGNGSIS